MDLHEFVANLDDRSFRTLMDACVARFQNSRMHDSMPVVWVDVHRNLENSRMHDSMLEAERHLAGYNRLQAIKAVRTRLNLGLKEAKDLVDREVPRDAKLRCDY